jgi:hypothetical protein
LFIVPTANKLTGAPHLDRDLRALLTGRRAHLAQSSSDASVVVKDDPVSESSVETAAEAQRIQSRRYPYNGE